MKHAKPQTKRSWLKNRIRFIDVIALVLASNCLIMGVYFYASSHSRLTLLIPFFGALVVIIFWFLYRFKNNTYCFVTKKLFPIALVTLSLMYGFAFPPGSVPDEFYHFKASYYYSNLIEHPDNPHLIRAEDEDALAEGGVMSKAISQDSLETIKENIGPFATKNGTTENSKFNDFADSINITGNPPQLKIPAALGILFAKLLGLNSLWLYYFGMIFNLAFGAALIIASVRITPYGQKVFMAIALLPMTLHLLGSHSYDVGTLGLAFLLIALIFRAIEREGEIRDTEVIAIIVTGCLLAPCKVVYTLIVFLIVLVPSSRFSSRRKGIAIKALVILAPFAVVVLFRLSSILTMAGVTQVESQGAIQKYTFGTLLSHPLHTIGLLFGTLHDLGWIYLYSFVGSSLGWFQPNIVAPHYVTIALLMLLGFAIMPSPDDEIVLASRSRIAFSTVFIAVLTAVMVALCVDWTPITNSYIEGIQGRYFLPVAPLLFMGMRGRTICVTRCVAFTLILSFIAIDATYIGYIFARI